MSAAVDSAAKAVHDHAHLDAVLRLVGEHRDELVGDFARVEAVLLEVDGRLGRLHVGQQRRVEVLAIDVELHRRGVRWSQVERKVLSIDDVLGGDT